MQDLIIIFNAGSSSIKFSLFDFNHLELFYDGILEFDELHSKLSIYDTNKNIIISKLLQNNYQDSVNEVFEQIIKISNNYNIKAIGHRVVHGGEYFRDPVIVNDQVISVLMQLIPLAPLHQPHNIEPIKVIQSLYPNMKQVICFDTAFHANHDIIAKSFAIPRKLTQEGIVRYGFHGISYEYINAKLKNYIDTQKYGNIIVAHLGNGASMCAIKNGESIATSMGFTALDGLMMGTRSGTIDPGVILYLTEEKGYTIKEIEHMLYYDSGLKGVSGISNDVRTLLDSKSDEAKFALDLFCYRASQELARLCVNLDELNVIVFTAGIGENSWQVRDAICKRLTFLGVKLDHEANLQNLSMISAENSKVIVLVIKTDEDLMIAQHVQSILNKNI